MASTRHSFEGTHGNVLRYDVKQGLCRVCDVYHVSSRGTLKVEMACWNKHNRKERHTDRYAFRELAEANPDKYFKKQRVV